INNAENNFVFIAAMQAQRNPASSPKPKNRSALNPEAIASASLHHVVGGGEGEVVITLELAGLYDDPVRDVVGKRVGPGVFDGGVHAADVLAVTEGPDWNGIGAGDEFPERV